MDERIVELVEANAVKDLEYTGHIAEAIRRMDSLIEQLDPAGQQALLEIEQELALAQGVAIRRAYLQGVAVGKRLVHSGQA